MPPSRAALRSGISASGNDDGRGQDRAAAADSRAPAAVGEEMRSAGSSPRLAYAAGGAVAGIAMMFAVIGWRDRSAASGTVESECTGRQPRTLAASRIATTEASGSMDPEEDAEVSAAVAMIALGFGALVGRDPAPASGPGSKASARQPAVRIEDRAMAFRRLAAGYGAAAIEPYPGDNRRRADRRVPTRTHPAGAVDRRSAVRRITDAVCEPRTLHVRGARRFAGARMETI
jgi:hypothetical protein